MNPTDTIKLLQSQLPVTQAKTSPLQARDDNVTATAGQQQNTGEEFSTFLTLLTAQIQNQDPLAPLDSTQFVEQLATFTNLELQAKGNDTLDLIAALLVRQIELISPEESTNNITRSKNSLY